MARGYGVGNYGDAFFGVTKYVDAVASAAVSASVESNATATFTSAQPQAIAATVTASADMVRVKLVESIVESASVIVSNAETVVASSAVINAAASAQNVPYIRIRLVSAATSVQCTATGSAVEKWEPIAQDSQSWSTIEKTPIDWSNIAA